MSWRRRWAAHKLIAQIPPGETGSLSMDGDETGDYRLAVNAELITGLARICRAREQDLVRAGEKGKASELMKLWAARIQRAHQG